MMKTKLHLTLMMLLVMVLSLFVTGCGDDSSEEPEPELGELEAKIDESGISFITDTKAIDARRIKASQQVTFADGSSGEPDNWTWSFGGGLETITDQNATVTWDEAVGQVMVVLTVSRSEDGATDADTIMIQVGPVEMLNRAVFGFETSEDSDIDPMSKWFSWTPNDGTISVSLESDGANGTSRSMKLTATSGFGEFQLRPHENAPEYLVSLESQKAYVFSFYMKASQDMTLSEASVLNVRNDDPKEGWNTPLWTGDASITDPELTAEWVKYSYEFTTPDYATFSDEGYLDGTADNAGPFFKHFGTVSGSELMVWVDEISLKEKETE